MELKRFRKILGDASQWVRFRRRGGGETLVAPVRFRLRFKGHTIGVLSADANGWTFRYTDEFRRQKNLRPLVGFPSLEREYRSPHLWPFFLGRIPSIKQDAVREIIRDESIDPSSAVQLLRRFGRRTISSPYELV